MLTLALGVLAVGGTPAGATPTELFFSEYIEGSSNNKALEIYNGTGGPIDLAAGAYNVQMCFNGNPTCTLTINLTGVVASGDVFVLAQASAAAAILAQADQTNGSGWFNGDDAVLLRKGAVVIDSIGQRGFDPGSEWGSGLLSTADNTLRRQAGIEAGDAADTDVFSPAAEWDGFANDTFDGLGFHGEIVDEPVVASCGAISVFAGNAGSTTVSATDADDTVTDIQITAISPSPSSGSISLSNLVPAAADGGTATATVTSSADVPAGTYTATVTATNDQATPKTGSCALTVTVKQIRTIGEIQGSVSDTANGATFRSPFAPASGNGSSSGTVTTRGVVYQLYRSGNNRGFFIQSAPGTADADPNSSDGIFVFMGGFTSLIGGYTPQLGDEIVITGRVAEFNSLTQLTSATAEQVLGSFLDLSVVTPPQEVNPPAILSDANRYWERREGMRLLVPAGSLSVDGQDRFGADAEQWLMRADSPVAGRANPFARRVFRDPHPLDDIVEQLFDNGNGYRIMLGAGGLKGMLNDPSAIITPIRTYETIANALVGGLYFSFNKYGIQIVNQPVATPGVDPSTNNPPQPAGDGEYAVANYNVENLYDLRDDPFDGCDFVGNSGCPGVSPPFNYVPASQEVYEEHLGAIADQIVDDLHSPDIILVQEAEDQDICTVEDGDLVCGSSNNADGQPDTLQEAALAIADNGGPTYAAAFDRNGADDRGIVSAFMYRTDRVQLLTADDDHPVLGESPTVEYRAPGLAYNTDVSNPKALNADLPGDVDSSTGLDGSDVFTRAPQVGLFRVWRNGIGNGVWTDIYALSNHFSSTPNARVGQRTEQANYAAAIVDALGDGARVVVGGDFNVYPRPDDAFAPGHPQFGADQLGAFYDLSLEAMWQRIADEVPEAAYSYVFEGQTQTLDTQFLTPAIAAEVVQSRVAHINADFPADFPGDGARGASDHDPMATRIEVPVTIESLTALLQWCTDNGQVDGKNTQRQLQHHLDKGQIGPFVNQTLGKTPQFVTESCSAALVSSAQAIG